MPHDLEGLLTNILGGYIVAQIKAVVVLTVLERLQANIALTGKNTLSLLNHLPREKTKEQENGEDVYDG